MNYIKISLQWIAILPFIGSFAVHGMIQNTLHLQPAEISITGPFIDQTLKLYKVEGDLYKVSQKRCHKKPMRELCKLLDNTAHGFSKDDLPKDEKQQIAYFVRKNKHTDIIKLSSKIINKIGLEEDWTLERTEKVITDFLAIRCALALKKEGLMGKKGNSSLG